MENVEGLVEGLTPPPMCGLLNVRQPSGVPLIFPVVAELPQQSQQEIYYYYYYYY